MLFSLDTLGSCVSSVNVGAMLYDVYVFYVFYVSMEMDQIE